jgi:hypothetical protein
MIVNQVMIRMAANALNINTHEIYLKNEKRVTWYATAEAMVAAASGKVNAHHDIKNLSRIKLLYIVPSNAIKK